MYAIHVKRTRKPQKRLAFNESLTENKNLLAHRKDIFFYHSEAMYAFEMHILHRGEHLDFIRVGVESLLICKSNGASNEHLFSISLSFVLLLEIQMIALNTNRNPVASAERSSSIT